MIEGNPFIDDKASMVPDKGGAAGKPVARFDGSRIANSDGGIDWNQLGDWLTQLVKGGMELAGQVIASKNGATTTTTPTAVIQKKDNSAMWVLVGLVAVALVVGLLIFMKKRK